MKEILITRDDLLQFMTQKNYLKFLTFCQKELKNHELKPIWIIAQILEQKDYF